MAIQPQPQPQPQDTRTFPTTDDLCHLSLDDARTALRVLDGMVITGAASVHYEPITRLWMVDLPITRRCLALADWASEWWAQQGGVA